MSVVSLYRLVVRHWRVTVPVALLTLVALVGVVRASPPTYSATGSTVLLSSPEPPYPVVPAPDSKPTGGENPFARYDLAVVADIVARALNSDSRRAELERKGVVGYEAVANEFQPGPVVEVEGEGLTPESAARSTRVVLAEVPSILAEMQRAEGAEPDTFVTSAPLEPASTAEAMYSSTARAAIGVLALGGLLLLGLVALAETLTGERRQRRAPVGRPVVSVPVTTGTSAQMRSVRPPAAQSRASSKPTASRPRKTGPPPTDKRGRSGGAASP